MVKFVRVHGKGSIKIMDPKIGEVVVSVEGLPTGWKIMSKVDRILEEGYNIVLCGKNYCKFEEQEIRAGFCSIERSVVIFKRKRIERTLNNLDVNKVLAVISTGALKFTLPS